MKWTTSCARAASNSPSANGSCSAAVTRTSTPGWRSRAAATNIFRRIDGRDGRCAKPLDKFGRQCSRTAADVKHTRWLGATACEVRERRRQPSGVAAHETVIGAGINGEAHHGIQA